MKRITCLNRGGSGVRKGIGILIIISLALLMAEAFASFVFTDTKTTWLELKISNNTAEKMKYTPTAGVDSFTYSCSITTPTDSADTTAINWTSPVQSMRLDVTLDTTKTYACSLDLGTNIYGFEYVCPNGADYDLESLIDTLVDSINNVAGFKDTVVAQDSVTYIKIVSRFAQVELEGEARWTMKVSAEMDTGFTWVTTVASACDTLTAMINADATTSAQITAADSATFVFMVADTAGHGFSLIIGDTTGDSTRVTANANGASSHQDTIPIVNLWRGDKYPKGVTADFILRAWADSGRGVGLSDSGYLWLFSAHNVAGNLQYLLLAADTTNDLPCTLSYDLTVDSTGSDTTLREQLFLAYRYWDTATDSNAIMQGTVTIDVKVMQGD